LNASKKFSAKVAKRYGNSKIVQKVALDGKVIEQGRGNCTAVKSVWLAARAASIAYFHSSDWSREYV
jgi:hypothetical protein